MFAAKLFQMIQIHIKFSESKSLTKSLQKIWENYCHIQSLLSNCEVMTLKDVFFYLCIIHMLGLVLSITQIASLFIAETLQHFLDLLYIHIWIIFSSYMLQKWIIYLNVTMHSQIVQIHFMAYYLFIKCVGTTWVTLG